MSNPDQANFDGDAEGDACDLDDDNDGIADTNDQCSETPLGMIVDATGCSLEQICPCDQDWKNHGSYVKCVSHTSQDFAKSGLISQKLRGEIVATAGRSMCGHKK